MADNNKLSDLMDVCSVSPVILVSGTPVVGDGSRAAHKTGFKQKSSEGSTDETEVFNTNTNKLYYSFLATVKPVMPTARFVFAGHNLLEWMNGNLRCEKPNCS